MGKKLDPILLEIRQMIYSFLGSSFVDLPSAGQVETMVQEQLFDEFPLEISEEDFQQGLKLLQSWVRESERNHFNEVLTLLQEDYTALFIGPGHLLAPPWESVYLTEERLTFGVSTMEVRECYLRHGLVFARKNSEPDDHFGLEMEFMSKLIAKQCQSFKAGQQEEAALLAREQLCFLQEHILKWLNDFTANILNNARTPYFQGLALLARGYLTWDREHLEHQTELEV